MKEDFAKVAKKIFVTFKEKVVGIECRENLKIKVSAEFKPLSANSTKWSNTLKQFVGKLPTICLSVFDHFVGLALKRLNCWKRGKSN